MSEQSIRPKDALWNDFIDEYCFEEIKDGIQRLKDDDYFDKCYVEISYNDLHEYDEELAEQYITSPERTSSEFIDTIVRYKFVDELETEPDEEDIDTNDLHIRVTEVPEVPIREITHHHLDNLLTVEGVVQQVTDPQPRFLVITFECLVCGGHIEIIQKGEDIQAPDKCTHCERNTPLQTVQELSEYIHHQRLRIQESPEELQGGQDPRSIDVHIDGDLVDVATPGDRVTVTGRLTHPDPLSSKGKSPVVTTYIEANHVTTEVESVSVKKITDKDEKEIKAIANDNPLESVVGSIAPSIYGVEQEKLAIALQMFSGVRKNVGDKRIRGDMHVLLLGDPGTAKSQLLQYVSDVMPRSSYTTGEGSSKVGLTGAAVKSDLGDGEWTIEAGVLVLSDNGIACVDELDKLNDGTDALHSALEQQKVNIAKAGINTTMNARCGLLAAANPQYGRWDQYEPIAEQIDLPPAIISRFDLIFTLVDDPDPEFDSKLARSILDTNQAGQKLAQGEERDTVEEVSEPDISYDLLPKYIMYARNEVKPVLTDDAKDTLEEFYVDMREHGAGDGEAVPVTARKLEALVRLAEASARIRLSDDIEKKDAELAIEIVKSSLEQVGIDPDTGEYDVDMVETGKPKSQRDRIKSLKQLLKDMQEDYDDGVPISDLIEAAEDVGIEQDKVEHELKKMKDAGEVYEPSHKRFRIT